jgi:predicted transcriptional regulator of viral defense system/very-short-patch-repair endonuclease
VDAQIAALAEAQHGVVSRSQLEALGLEESAIDRRLRAGRLHNVHAAVFAVGHPLISRKGRWMAAVLAIGAGAVLSHRSAAELWGLRRYCDGPIHVTLPSKSRHVPGIRRHSSRVLPADEVTISDEVPGIPVTSVPRTIFDCAAGGDVDLVENLIREAEYRELYDLLSLPHLLARYPRRRGCRTVKTALVRLEESPSGHTASRLEERFLSFLRAYGLPIPRLNEWIELGDRRYRVDARWPGTKEIVELDSWEAHGTRTAFRDDRERDRRLRVAGYGLTRITWSQLDHEPAAIAADLRALLRVEAAYKRP